jgi:hypothetical protein
MREIESGLSFHPARSFLQGGLMIWTSRPAFFTLLALAAAVAVGPSGPDAHGQTQPAYSHYFGNTHSHSQNSDGGGTPADHFRLAKQYGYDFYSLTDHALVKYAGYTAANYIDTKNQANAYTDGAFVGIAGFEFSENDGPAGTGHCNALNTASTLDATGSTVNYPVFYDWLINNQSTTVVATFNHPGTTSYNSFGYLTDARCERMAMLEAYNGTGSHYAAFLVALEKGWRVAPILGLDNHGLPPSGGGRTGVLAPSLTRENVLQAMRARRVYATLDKNLKVTFKANGQIMGSTLYSPTSLNLEISISDPDTGVAGDKITKIDVIGNNGTVVGSQTFSAHSVTWNPSYAVSQKYYFLAIYAADKTDGPTAYSAPVWIDTSTPAVPAAPSVLAATAVSPSRIDLAWKDNSLNESGFKIERKTGSGGIWAQVATPGAGATAWSNTGLSASTTYFYRVRATNAGGDSAWSNEASATTHPPASGIGLYGEYFDDTAFASAKVSRIDASINFDWGAGSPDASIGADSFGVRWSGAVEAAYSEPYTFTTLSDDGVRLWVNGTLLVDNWTVHGPMENSGTLALVAGRKVEIRLDYYESGGGATVKLFWASAKQAREIVPQNRLYPWANRDVGSVAAEGSTSSHSGPAFTVRGSGADIWGTADGFHYVYRLLTGDGEIRARLTSQENTNAWAKAGMMMRETLEPGSRHAMMVITPGNGASFQRRTAVGGAGAYTSGGAAAAPLWVRLVRRGNNFSGYRSADGTAWTWVGTATMGMGPMIHVGLPVTSHVDGTLCAAQFDNVATAATPAAAGALVEIVSVSTEQPYSLAEASAGVLPYIDRSYAATSLSAGLEGGTLVRTAMDDKYVTVADHLTLRLGQEAQVYVCIDKRGIPPAWLNDGSWTLTGESIVTSDAASSPLQVYVKTVPAGLLTLGGNHTGGDTGARANYLVVVRASSAPAAFEEGPVPADRWQNEVDLDGDGLTDDFETANGLDPDSPDTDGDGVPDESALAPDGRPFGDVQAGVAAVGSVAGEDGGGGRCGSVGLDLLLPLGLLWILRRRRLRRS